jgi:hypothetical protein
MTNPLLILLAASALILQGANQPQPTATNPSQSATAVPSKIGCANSSVIPVKDRTPELCVETELAQHGHPVMFPLRNGVAYGVSLNPDKPLVVNIWMDNQTDKTQNYYICCNLTFAARIDLYDAKGHRIPSRIDFELEKAGLADGDAGWGCGCSGWSVVPPHTLQVVDGGDLKANYTLAPGSYSISERPIPEPRKVSMPPQAGPSPIADRPQTGVSLAISVS